MNKKFRLFGLGLLSLFLLISSVSAAIDTSKVGVAVGDTFTYESKVIASDSSSNTGFGNGSLVLEVLGLPNSSHLAEARLTFPNGTTDDGHVNMTSVGDFFIYSDWDYWMGADADLGLFENGNVTDEGDLIEFSYRLDFLGLIFEYTAQYQKTTGVLELFNLTTSGFGAFSTVYFELTDVKTGGESSPGFELIAVLPLIAVGFIRKRKAE